MGDQFQVYRVAQAFELAVFYAKQTASVPCTLIKCRRLDDRCLSRLAVERGRKVRTPQGSVPDNVRGLRFKA